MNYRVQPGDTPAIIAQRFTGDGARAPELIAYNPYKKRVVTQNGITFYALRVGEMLNLPPTWRVTWGNCPWPNQWVWNAATATWACSSGAAALAGLPMGVTRGGAGLGLTLTSIDDGSSTLANAQSELQTALSSLSDLSGGTGDAGTVLSNFKQAVNDFANAATTASSAANSAQQAVVTASPQGQNDPTALSISQMYSAIQGNLTAITTDYNTISGISDPIANDPTAAANDAQSQAQQAVSQAQSAIGAASAFNPPAPTPTPGPPAPAPPPGPPAPAPPPGPPIPPPPGPPAPPGPAAPTTSTNIWPWVIAGVVVAGGAVALAMASKKKRAATGRHTGRHSTALARR